MKNNSNFVMGEIPQFHPKSLEYLEYWKQEKRACIEGIWGQGYWMPGNLYFYVNHWHILLNTDNFSKAKSLAKPFCRDLEWQKAYIYAEARGFSGFRGDEEVSCFRMIKEFEDKLKAPGASKDILVPSKRVFPDECFKKDGTLKTYENARDYLKKFHLKTLGKPLYQNQAKNVVDIECRGSGKSYWAAGGMIAHNFLFDGAVDYDAFLAAAAAGKFMSSETLVGAISTSFSADLLSKVALGLESLLGGQHLDDGYHPSPLSKKTMGTLAPGKNPLVSKFKKDVGGSWKEMGSMSKLHHRSFKDKPTAGNGTRPGLTILEEVGFMGNLKDALGPLKQCTMDGSSKFGTIYMFGTGGDMDGGATEAVRDVFYEPDAWDCLVFDDVFEQRGKIGYFVPYAYGLNQFKDDQGNTNVAEAQGFVDQVRYDLSQKKSKKPLNMEMQDNPNVPSEAFLVSTGNIFPIAELQDQLGFLESMDGTALAGQNGNIILEANSKTGTKWVPDLKQVLTPCDYPTGSTDDTDGCVQIWEHPPVGDIPHGMFLAGTDPYDQDRAPNSNSLGSTLIYKVGDIRDNGTKNMIVAEYTARPETAEEHHENVRKLLMYYNASCLYENERNTIKYHFKDKNSLHLMARQPDCLKATENSGVQRGYGTHMTIQIKEELEVYARDWLTRPAGEGLHNYHLIFSKPLLKELIAYNKDGNFDRVISFLLCIYIQLQNHHVKIEKLKDEPERDEFFDDDNLF